MRLALQQTIGWLAIASATYAAGCGTENAGDPRHREPRRLEQALPKGTPNATNGQLDFCTGGLPCARGEGDCDRDSECEAGLVCGYDNLERFLTGACSGCDACVQPHCRDGIRTRTKAARTAGAPTVGRVLRARRRRTVGGSLQRELAPCGW
jgi:hypothetical protein